MYVAPCSFSFRYFSQTRSLQRLFHSKISSVRIPVHTYLLQKTRFFRGPSLFGTVQLVIAPSSFVLSPPIPSSFASLCLLLLAQPRQDRPFLGPEMEAVSCLLVAAGSQLAMRCDVLLRQGSFFLENRRLFPPPVASRTCLVRRNPSPPTSLTVLRGHQPCLGRE